MSDELSDKEKSTPNSADGVGRLFDAIQAGEKQLVENLLSQDVGLAEAHNEHGVPAVLWALYNRQQAIAELIAESRIGNNSGLSLHEAVAIGDADRAREHLNLGNDLGEFSPDGFTPLHFAAFFGREAIVPLLLAQGAAVAVPARNPSGVHPLHSAAAVGSVAICQMLLLNGASVDAQQHGGFTALMSAGLHGNVALIELLLEHGADVAIESDEGKTAADMAEEAGHADAVQRLHK